VDRRDRGNVANAQDAVTPGQPVYRDEEVVAASLTGLGIRLRRGRRQGGFDSTRIGQGILTYDPGNPLANKAGDVTYPEVNIGTR